MSAKKSAKLFFGLLSTATGLLFLIVFGFLWLVLAIKPSDQKDIWSLLWFGIFIAGFASILISVGIALCLNKSFITILGVSLWVAGIFASFFTLWTLLPFFLDPHYFFIWPSLIPAPFAGALMASGYSLCRYRSFAPILQDAFGGAATAFGLVGLLCTVLTTVVSLTVSVGHPSKSGIGTVYQVILAIVAVGFFGLLMLFGLAAISRALFEDSSEPETIN